MKFQELRQLSSENPSVKILEIELKKYDQYPEIIKQVEEVVQGEGLNVLFNNAGISPRSSFHGIPKLKVSELMDTFEVNCVAPLMLTKAFLPLLKKAANHNKSLPVSPQRAAVINMSSILGSVALNNDGSLYHYRLTKTGLNNATKSMSVDFKPFGILALSMHPGWVKTDLGGPKAPMDVETSCKHMVQTILKLDEKSNGTFIQYDGKKLPW